LNKWCKFLLVRPFEKWRQNAIEFAQWRIKGRKATMHMVQTNVIHAHVNACSNTDPDRTFDRQIVHSMQNNFIHLGDQTLSVRLSFYLSFSPLPPPSLPSSRSLSPSFTSPPVPPSPRSLSFECPLGPFNCGPCDEKMDCDSRRGKDHKGEDQQKSFPLEEPCSCEVAAKRR
jgi:hypothetical protein